MKTTAGRTPRQIHTKDMFDTRVLRELYKHEDGMPLSDALQKRMSNTKKRINAMTNDIERQKLTKLLEFSEATGNAMVCAKSTTLAEFYLDSKVDGSLVANIERIMELWALQVRREKLAAKVETEKEGIVRAGRGETQERKDLDILGRFLDEIKLVEEFNFYYECLEAAERYFEASDWTKKRDAMEKIAQKRSEIKDRRHKDAWKYEEKDY